MRTVRNRIVTHIISFILIFLLLTLFYGGYLVLTSMYQYYPKDEYYLEGTARTRGQIIMWGFANVHVVVESLIISLIATITSYFFKKRKNGVFITAALLTFLVTFIYFIYNTNVAELKEKTFVLAVIIFTCSVFTLALINKLVPAEPQ